MVDLDLRAQTRSRVEPLIVQNRVAGITDDASEMHIIICVNIERV